MANEKRLISVDEWDSFFAEHIYNRCFRNEYEQGYTDALDRVDDWMDAHPTVDAVEVVHGKWEIFDDGYGCELMCCSVCKSEFYDGDNDTVDHPHNFCPNCGAKMDGDGNG